MAALWGGVASTLRPLSEGVEIPVLPTLLALVGAGFIVVFGLQALKPVQRAPRPRRAEAPAPKPKEIRPPPPAAAAPEPEVQFRKAPLSIHFPKIPSSYPDVWGVGEPVDIAVQLDDKKLHAQRDIPGLTVTIGDQEIKPQFSKGVWSYRHTFAEPREVPVVADLKVKGEDQPRRTKRVLKIVRYRQEITEVFHNFREEASRVIAPIREDATPWEIYDVLTEANPKLPGGRLREIISCFEEAKYSNHAVSRETYTRMIDALLQLENVEL